MSKIITAPGSITRLKHNLAFVEESNIATNNIKKDQYVIWKDVACRASSDINIGDTLTSGKLSALSSGGGLNNIIDDISVLNTHVEYLPSTTISDLTDIPVNSQGRADLAAGISPTGALVAVNYQCYGSSARRTITASVVASAKEYVNFYNGSNWTGWSSLYDSIADMNVASRSGLTINTDKFAGSGSVYKLGKLCIVSFCVRSTDSIPSSTLIATVPSVYRPSAEVKPLVVEYDRPSQDIAVYNNYCGIGTDGKILQNFTSSGVSGATIRATYAYTV